MATRTTAAVTDTYAYVGLDPVAWRVTTAGSSVSGVIDPAGGRLASSDGSAVRWLLPDLHANLAAALDPATLAVVGASRYDAYGVTLATAAGSSAAGPWGYQGRLDLSPDPAAPLYDFGARPYAPGLGVFTSLDTYPGAPADPLSMNRYLYAAANPATFIDPTGHYVERTSMGGAVNQDQHEVCGQSICGHEFYVQPNDHSRDVQRLVLGFLGLQVKKVVDLPGAAVSLAWGVPGAAVAAPGFVADVVRDPGRAAAGFRSGVETGVHGAAAWIVRAHGDLTSGDPWRMANAASQALDVAALAIGGVAAGRSVVGRGAAVDDTIDALAPILSASRLRLNASEVMQRLTTSQADRLAADPSIAASVLTQSEYHAGQLNATVARLQYGNAVERLVAREIQQSTDLQALFGRVGGANHPDFIGLGQYAGMNFGITTAAQFLANAKAGRWYGPGLIQPVYTRPSAFTVFP